jgi:bacterioferritin-associated ferredoxin
MAFRVDRCVCLGRTFAELRAEAAAAGLHTVDELQRRVPVGTRCGLCLPYVRRMLAGGPVVFGEPVTQGSTDVEAGHSRDPER